MHTGTRRWAKWAGVALGAKLSVASAWATPPSGFTSTTLAMGRFEPISATSEAVIAGVELPEHARRLWLSFQRTKGLSDLYVQSNAWAPGGSTGWHTHPGHSLIIVTEGSITAYDRDDPSCTAQVYTTGMGFVDPGGGQVHLLRNEGSSPARTIAVQLLPAEATRRIDALGSSACPF